MGIGHLVRGLRGHTDVDDEMASARINREITDGLETVIFVPEIYHEELSSSLVRSIVGLRNWRDILKDRVPSAVIKKLELVHFEALLSNSIVSQSVDLKWLCEKMSRPYHNIHHSYNVLDNVYYDAHDNMEKEAIVLAAAFHDISSNEVDSFNIFTKKIDESNQDFELTKNCLTIPLIKRVCELIMATDHSKSLSEDQLKDEILCDFVSADLMILASNEDDYNNYSECIRKEYNSYSDKEYLDGRISFLNKLLEEKKTIFPDLLKYKEFEAKARANIFNEINKLKRKI
jgi:predicted metal-dependent HD superfamily phosphohydrolase